MPKISEEGRIALDLLVEAATLDGYARGHHAAASELADWRSMIDANITGWSATNPQYNPWPEVVGGMSVLATDDIEAYRHLVGEIIGNDPSTYAGLRELFGFLQSIADDHDYTIAPGPDGARVTFDGKIGQDGIRGLSPLGLWEVLEPMLAADKDAVPGQKGF